MKNPGRLLIVAGGTGGHISPGLALAEAAVARGISVRFLSIPRNREYPEFQNPPWKMEWYPAPAPKADLVSLLRFGPAFAVSLVRAMGILLTERPDAVVALGGYPSLPAAVAAILLRVPLFLCEQNAIPGRVTKALSPFAKRIFLTFPVNALKKASVLLVGNPVRRRLRERAEKDRRPEKKGKSKHTSASGRSQKKGNRSIPVILALGGSQGAVQLNEMLLRLWKEHPRFSSRYHWILQTGREHLERMKERARAELAAPVFRRIELFGFDSDIYRYYERADLFIGRAGAGNITEAALFSLPMVLVPYPFAKDGHQKANALSVVNEGAGLMVDRLDDHPDDLKLAIEREMSRSVFAKMRDRSRSLARPDAPDRILDEIAR